MKKSLILCLIIGLAFSVTGATCMKSVQGVACNPPASVLVVAAAAAPIIAIAINMLIPGSEAWATAANAQGAITALQGGICISATQLNNLIAFLQSNVFKTAQAKAMAKRVILDKGTIQVVNVQPLIEWADKFK